MMRPNAIDLRVDQLSAHDLLTHSAAVLVDPERQIAAQRLVHWFLPGWFVSIVFSAIALAYFWQSGGAARVRDLLRRRVANEWLLRFYFGCVLGGIVRAAELIPQFYMYRVERLMSLTDQLVRAWALDWLSSTIATMIVIGIVTAIVLSLAARTHQWYIYTIAGIFAACFFFAYIAPFIAAPAFDQIVPPPLAAQRIARQVETSAGLQVPLVEQVRKRTHLGAAYVIGFGSTERIVLGDAVFAVAGPQELRYVIARQLGYAKDDATIKIALTDALLLILSVAIAVAIADRFPFRRDDDPLARLSLVGTFLAGLYLIAVPVDNAVLRAIDANADRYALSLGVDRAAVVRSVIRDTDQRLVEVCPDILARAFMQRTIDASVTVAAANGVPAACPP